MKRLCSLGVAVCLLVIGIAPISADEETAKKLYMSGLEKLAHQDYEGAVEEFESSYEAHPNPNCLYNLAVCYFKLERFGDSLSAFKSLQETFPDKFSEKVTLKIKELEGLLPSLSISTTPTGATVVVDGRNRGETPLEHPLLISTGVHHVLITKDGWEEMTREVTVTSGQRADEVFKLQKRKGALTVNVNEPGATVQVDDVPMGTTPLAQPLVLPEGPHRVKVVKSGYGTMEEKVVVTSSDPRTLEMSLLLIPKRTAMPITTPIDQTDTPWYKDSTTRLIIGGVGTGIMAGVSTGLWAATFKRRNDHNDKNTQLDPEQGGEWDDEIGVNRDEDRETAIKYNKAAVATTIVTGAFLAATLTELVFRIVRKKKGKDTAWLQSGVSVTF